MKQGTTGSTKPLSTTPRFFSSIANQLKYGSIVNIFLMLLIMTFIFTSRSFNIQQQMVNTLQQNRSESIAIAIANHIQRQYEDLEALAELVTLDTLSPEEQTDILVNIPQHNTGDRIAVIVDKTGKVSAVYPDNIVLQDSYVQRMQRAAASSTAGIALIPDVSLPGHYALIMGISLHHANGSQYGMLLLQTDLTFLQGIFTGDEIEYDGYAYMLDRPQNLLVYVNHGELVQKSGTDSAFAADLVTGKTLPTSGWSRILRAPIYRGLFGKWVLRQETAVPGIDLNVIVEFPITTAYAPIISMVYETILFLILAAMGTLGVGYYLSQKLVIPLNQLTTAATQISKGNLSIHLDVNPHNEFGLLATAFNRMIAQLQETVNVLEKRVEERTDTINRRSLQIQAAATTARDATSATELTELLDRAVNLVPSRFGYYHAGIFLADGTGEYAILRAATGAVGQEMLRRHHRLRVGSEGIVGRVIATGSPYITADTHQDTVYWPNPLLPETRSEMGLPLRVGDRVIGAMNVQSRKIAAFEEEDITILQILTDQLAVAIEKTRLFEKTQAMLTERLHTIVSNVPLILFAFDHQGVITLAEGKGLSILNVEAINFAGLSVFDVFRREPAVLADIQRALQGKTVAATVSLRGFTWDIRYIPVLDKEGAFTGVIGVAADITERRRAEESLREKERQLRQIIDLVPHMIFARDMEGRYLLVNQTVADAYGTTVDQITDSSSYDWHTAPAELEKFLQDDRDVITSGQAKFIAEDVFTDASGKQRALQTSKIPLAWDGGVKTAVLGVSVDITERKQAEEALRQAQKLESLGILAGGVAHDFNNLLVAILGQTSLALVRLPKESPARQAIEKATKAAERAADLTRQLLAYSGRGHFEVQPLNLNILLQENLHLLEVAVPKNVLLRPELTEPLPLIEADAGQMQQIIMNLILNGADAIGSEAGTVTVVTSVQGIDADDRRHWRYTGEPLPAGQYVSLEVHDSGHGMDNQTLSKIFDPFFTTKKTGRGLGLAAVLGIVRGHRGGIRVYSEIGKGTTFKILFPAVAQTTTHLSALESVAEQAEQSGLILIIDDEQSVRETATDILHEEGFMVIGAVDGQQGLTIYREKMDEVLVVLLDLSMPGLSGEETFRQLRQLNPDVPVVLSSGYNQVEATRRFVGKGLAGFLQKPYSAHQLVTEIRKRANIPEQSR